jgi:fumarate reductase subunit D
LIRQIFSTAFLSIGVGFICQLAQVWLGTSYFDDFLKSNLINLLVALLAINTASMGIVLTKIRDLVDRHGNQEAFKNTRKQMLLSVKEQLCLIVLSIVVLTVSDSIHVIEIENLDLLIKTTVSAIFVYSMVVLYDTAISVLVIIDFQAPSE